MQTLKYLSVYLNSNMNKMLIASLALATISLIGFSTANAQSFEPIAKTPDIYEDQIITCVKDVSDKPTRGSLICHIFDTDDLDWYQEISEVNYGKIGSLDDSFEMGLID